MATLPRGGWCGALASCEALSAAGTRRQAAACEPLGVAPPLGAPEQAA